MTMVIPLGWQVVDANGAPYSGAKAYFYTTGTTTPKDTYSVSALTLGLENANPLVADASGRFPVAYGPTTADYKVVLKTSADVTIATYDPVQMTGAVASLSVDTGQLVNDAVTNAKLANMAANTFKGRVTAGTGDPEDLTATQVLSILDTMALISTLTASSSSSLDFTAVNATLYSGYLCLFEGIYPATDGASLLFRVSVDGGSSYLATASYHEARIAGGGTTAAAAAGALVSTSITLAAVMSTGSTSFAFRGNATVGVGGAVSLGTWIDCTGSYGLQTTGERLKVMAGGGHSTASQVNAFQFKMSSGNIASGTIRVFGIPK